MRNEQFQKNLKFCVIYENGRRYWEGTLRRVMCINKIMFEFSLCGGLIGINLFIDRNFFVIVVVNITYYLSDCGFHYLLLCNSSIVFLNALLWVDILTFKSPQATNSNTWSFNFTGEIWGMLPGFQHLSKLAVCNMDSLLTWDISGVASGSTQGLQQFFFTRFG